MPVTPYHFGPALVAKGLLKSRFCILTFAVSQVMIDLESLYNLLQGTWPVHRFFHTYIGSTGAIGATILIMQLMSKITRYRLSKQAIIFSGFFGGYSHVLLDSIMHSDIRPFYPLTESNHLLKIISLSSLHDMCVFSGIVGLSIIVWNIRLFLVGNK